MNGWWIAGIAIAIITVLFGILDYSMRRYAMRMLSRALLANDSKKLSVFTDRGAIGVCEDGESIFLGHALQDEVIGGRYPLDVILDVEIVSKKAFLPILPPRYSLNIHFYGLEPPKLTIDMPTQAAAEEWRTRIKRLAPNL